MNGSAFDYFAPTIYKCTSVESLEEMSIPVEKLPLHKSNSRKVH